MVRGLLRAAVATKVRAGLLAVVVVGAVVAAAVATGVLGAPAVASVSNHFGAVDEETTTIHTDLVVTNPNPVGVSLGDVSVAYAVDLNDVRMASGAKEGVAVGSGDSTVALETAMRNERIPAWWVSHLRNGEHSELVVHATVTSGTLNESVAAPAIRRDVDTDVASSFNSTETRPIEADQEPLIDDPVLYVNETAGWWGQVTEDATTIEMRFDVYNPKPYAVPVQEVRYDVSMNGVAMGSGSTERSYVVPAGESRTVAAELTLRNDRLDEWWVSHLERNQVTDLAIELSMVVDLSGAPGGGPTVAVPVDTIEHRIDTDIFGNKARYPTGTDGNGSAAGSDEGTTPTATADGGGDAAGTETATDGVAATATATPTPTGTPTATSTDDGLLNGTDVP